MVNIPCLSLWQPWASLIAIGAKRIETRHWSTNYRGPLAIHAAKRINKGEMIELDCQKSFRNALSVLRPYDRAQMWDYLPFGAIVAVADLVACRPVESFGVGELHEPRNHLGETGHVLSWEEFAFGDYSPGRFGWVLENVRIFDEPIPQRGAQGLFRVTLPNGVEAR
jgi:activating signal cointegrator 1